LRERCVLEKFCLVGANGVAVLETCLRWFKSISNIIFIYVKE